MHFCISQFMMWTVTEQDSLLQTAKNTLCIGHNQCYVLLIQMMKMIF